MEARSANYRQRVREGFEGQLFMELIGAELQSIEPGVCEVALGFRDDLIQQHGRIHGGVVATLADTAAGFAAFSLMSDDEQPLSFEFKINLLAAATGESLIARSRVVKDGRRIKVCQADVFSSRSGKETLCATALVSVIAVGPRPSGKSEARNPKSE